MTERNFLSFLFNLHVGISALNLTLGFMTLFGDGECAFYLEAKARFHGYNLNERLAIYFIFPLIYASCFGVAIPLVAFLDILLWMLRAKKYKADAFDNVTDVWIKILAFVTIPCTALKAVEFVLGFYDYIDMTTFQISATLTGIASLAQATLPILFYDLSR